jgi:hypothetical protein
MVGMSTSSSRTPSRKKKQLEHKGSFLAPIVVSIIFSAVFTLLMINANLQTQVGFVSESTVGVAAVPINAIILSILPLVGGLILLIILRNRRQLILKAFIGGAFLVAGFVIFFLILSSSIYIGFSRPNWDLAFNLAIPLSLVLNIAFVYIVLSAKVSQKSKNVVAVLYGGGIGTLLGTSLQMWTGLLMAMLISIYDIYSVRRGPIKEIVKVSKEGGELIPGLSYVSRDWEIGLGDLGIYSMLISLAETSFGLIACALSMIGILIGSVLTLQLLKKREFLPGLPLTCLFGAIPIVFFIILP